QNLFEKNHILLTYPHEYRQTSKN
ncbi:DeoR family transcriptional regulator, partial [Lacticaseibacillus paracasei]